VDLKIFAKKTVAALHYKYFWKAIFNQLACVTRIAFVFLHCVEVQ